MTVLIRYKRFQSERSSHVLVSTLSTLWQQYSYCGVRATALRDGNDEPLNSRGYDTGEAHNK